MADVKFNIVVPCYNCVQWILTCLDSINNQTYKNFQVTIVNDCSTDGTREKIESWIVGKERFNLINNEYNTSSAIGNIIKATDSMNIDDNDVIINVDGDDWLQDNYVFEYLSGIYSNPDIWMTYGQFRPLSNSYSNFCRKVPDTKFYRHSGLWCASHLRTYRKKAFDMIDRKDFIDIDDPSKYLTSAGDVPLLMGLIEICGKRSHFIDKVLYVYNDKNSICDMYKDPGKQCRYADVIRKRQPYNEAI